MSGTGGWIGVDFDGTLVEYKEWTAWNVFGPGIPAMVKRVKKWRSEGKEVRIITARVFPYIPDVTPSYQMRAEKRCVLTGQRFTLHDMIEAVQAHCQVILGERLPVTCAKDYHMIEQWDDRAIQVVANTGLTIADEYESQIEALRGKVFEYASPHMPKLD